MPSPAEIKRLFLSANKYAVVGASTNQTKFGTKVLRWYLTRDLHVTPIHPKEKELEGISTLPTLSDLLSPAETSISIITPPKVTLELLKEANGLHIPALWLQPGAEDEGVIAYIKDSGLEDKVIYGGPCILVEGDMIRKEALEKTHL